MSIHRVIARAVMLAVAAGACWWLMQRFAPSIALAIWAGAMGILCSATAAIVNLQPPGKITFINYVMGYVLPWGYKIGRGKLLPIVIISWIIWVLIGAAVVIALHARTSPPAAAESAQRSTTVMVLLFIAWLVDGAALLQVIFVIAMSANRGHIARSLLGVTTALIAMIAGSIALVTLNQSPGAARLALLIAGGPLLLVSVGYGLFIVVILISGKKARWN